MKTFVVRIEEKDFDELKRRLEEMIECELSDIGVVREVFYLEDQYVDDLDLRENVQVSQIS